MDGFILILGSIKYKLYNMPIVAARSFGYALCGLILRLGVPSMVKMNSRKRRIGYKMVNDLI